MLTSSVARWSSLVARWAHNPKVAGSNPALATTEYDGNTRLRAVANANREVGVLRCGPSMAHAWPIPGPRFARHSIGRPLGLWPRITRARACDRPDRLRMRHAVRTD